MCHLRVSLRVFLMSLLVLLLTTAGCSVSVTPKQKKSSPQLTAEEELTLGQRAYHQIVQQKGGVYPDRELSAYVNRVGQQVVSESQSPELECQFQVVNDTAPNVFSLPGGFIAISRGLLIRLQSEAQLAAVLSYELGHVIARHHLQGVLTESLRSKPVALLADLSVDSDYAELLASLPPVGTGLVDKQFSREQEMEADQIGIDLLVSAGYSPNAAIEYQELILEAFAQNGTNDTAIDLFRSHPFSAERLETIRNYVTAHYPRGDGRSGDLDFSIVIKTLQEIEDGYLLYDQGRNLERQGQIAEAIEVYHQALMIAPDEALILAGLGLAYLRNEDPVPARRYLIKAVNLQGDYAQSQLGLGYVYLQKWQYAQAVSHLEKSLQLLPTIEAAFLLAEAQQKIGNMVNASDLYLIVTSADRDGKLGQLAASRLQLLKGE